MKTIPFSKIRAHFTEVANEVQFNKKQYLLTRNNQPAFAMMPIEDLLLLKKLIERFEDEKDIKDYKERIKEKTSSIKDLWKELDID